MFINGMGCLERCKRAVTGDVQEDADTVLARDVGRELSIRENLN